MGLMRNLGMIRNFKIGFLVCFCNFETFGSAEAPLKRKLQLLGLCEMTTGNLRFFELCERQKNVENSGIFSPKSGKNIHQH